MDPVTPGLPSWHHGTCHLEARGHLGHTRGERNLSLQGMGRIGPLQPVTFLCLCLLFSSLCPMLMKASNAQGARGPHQLGGNSARASLGREAPSPLPNAQGVRGPHQLGGSSARASLGRGGPESTAHLCPGSCLPSARVSLQLAIA